MGDSKINMMWLKEHLPTFAGLKIPEILETSGLAGEGT